MNGDPHGNRRARILLAACFSLILAGLSLFLPPPPRAHANVLTVDTLTDDNIVNGNCTLREAILAANTNALVDNCGAGTPGSDTITFLPSLSGTIVITSNLPLISQDLIIDVPIPSSITVSGNKAYHPFLVMNGVTLNLSHLTIADGSTTGGGGAVFIDGGTLVVDNVVFSGNQAISNNGGAIYNSGGTLTIISATLFNNITTGNGGGIFSNGSATIANATIYSNSAVTSGGGIYMTNGVLNLAASSAYSNSASSDGGGIYLKGSTLLLTDGHVYSNTAIYSNGGGIYDINGGVILSNSSITSNVAISNGNSSGLGGGIYSGGALIIGNSNLSNNRAANLGGAIYAVTTTGTITGSILSGNHTQGALGGGGMVLAPNSAIIVDGTSFYNNDSTSAGGAITNFGNLAVTNSSIYSNTAIGGGGIFNVGTVTMTNVTIANNRATSNSGGGLFNACFGFVCTNPGMITVTNSTIAGNSASTTGGGIFDDVNVTVTLTNTIVANNTASSGANCIGTIIDGGKNLQWNPNTGCGFALAAGDPKLAPLANYGGATKTMGLFVGSAALEAALDAACPAKDQRGVTRPQGNHCDIGAFEGFLYPLYLPLIMR